MIHGTVVGLQARMSLIILPPEHSGVEIECVIDTGFEGFLTLPPSVIATLGLPYLININANLANNSSIETDVYLATVVWNGVERNIAAIYLVLYASHKVLLTSITPCSVLISVLLQCQNRFDCG